MQRPFPADNGADSPERRTRTTLLRSAARWFRLENGLTLRSDDSVSHLGRLSCVELEKDCMLLSAPCQQAADMKKIKHPQSIQEKAYNTFAGKILSGELAPGVALSEVSIARELGNSRGPLREAVRRLTAGRISSVNLRPAGAWLWISRGAKWRNSMNCARLWKCMPQERQPNAVSARRNSMPCSAL